MNDQPAGWLTRIGLAIARPRWAISIASDRRNAGRSGTDLLLLIAILIVATQLRGLATAIWLGAAVDVGLGARATVQLLTRALTLELGFLVVAALLLWASAGARRNLGRAFDVACVAAVSLLLVELAATTVVHLLDVRVPFVVGWILRCLSWAWAGAVLALAWRTVRAASSASVAIDPQVARLGKRAGLGVLALAVVGLAAQVTWIVGHLDLLRPVTPGDKAPGFALPAIEANGVLGTPLSPPSGKVTVIEFWATWCGPCKAALPKVDALVRRYPDTVGIAINLDDPAAARALFDDRRYRLTLASDDGTTSERYGVSTIPHIVVIDKKGFVRLVSRGSTASLEAAIVAAVQE